MTRIATFLLIPAILFGCELEDAVEVVDTGAEDTEESLPMEGTWEATAIEFDHDCGDDIELLTPEEFGYWELAMTGENTFRFSQDGVFLECVIEGHLLQCTYSENADDILSGEIFDSKHFRLYEIEGGNEDCVEDAYGDLQFVE